MKARKSAGKSEEDSGIATRDAPAYLTHRRPQHEIVDEAIAGLRGDLKEVFKKTLNA